MKEITTRCPTTKMLTLLPFSKLHYIFKVDVQAIAKRVAGHALQSLSGGRLLTNPAQISGHPRELAIFQRTSRRYRMMDLRLPPYAQTRILDYKEVNQLGAHLLQHVPDSHSVLIFLHQSQLKIPTRPMQRTSR